VVIGGLSAIHQFVRIGVGAMIGGMSGVESDVIPYGVVMGERASLAGLNITGMKRRGVSRDEIHALRSFFKKVFTEKTAGFSARVDEIAKEFSSQMVQEVASFVAAESSRAFCQPRNSKKDA
jgi:UDP-N-acetylglucosamine acyltransferase